MVLVAPPVAATTPPTIPFDVQEAPPSLDWNKSEGKSVVARNFLKSGETVMAIHRFDPDVIVLQETPLFVET